MTIRAAGAPRDGRDEARAREALVDEVRLLWNALVRRGEALHAKEDMSMGMRAVLERVWKDGPATVPAMARARGVSRQHVQSLVTPLIERGLLVARDNPAHRRSPLIELTGAGRRCIERMRRREAAAFFGRSPGLSEAELRGATDTLRRIRRAIDA